MKLPSGSAASPVPRSYLHNQMAFLTTHMGHAPVRGNYGSVVPAEELLDIEDKEGVTRPTILEESQCPPLPLPRLFLFLHHQVFPLAPHHCTAVVPVPGKRQPVNFSGHGSRHHHQKTLILVF
ncbi:3 beta-hydroxysteroid dehydrogenase/delta 5--_4-isomerase type 1 [Plakobranchus ocellatus]|uniref:3 beta-hydroxysteroid dehydrogenase/delta 5-->4-isomerase type 1 n=1 Tax=Plakobranchus ocellatus TaxID=259542 RepID=A0AAV4DJP2_9GAST|nr:3 beta-hydroxysteroid dehydrogenase/delta 5-->4-isomerase type 1 [Plakobranchus ocellatus]